MLSTVGRRRAHDGTTAEALLDAAERTIAAEGVDALSLREVASDAGTTTRAIYTLFGSKNGLVAALGARAFNLLQRQIETLPVTGQPWEDLVDVALIFRHFALEHPRSSRSRSTVAIRRSGRTFVPQPRTRSPSSTSDWSHWRTQICSADAASPKHRRSSGP